MVASIHIDWTVVLMVIGIVLSLVLIFFYIRPHQRSSRPDLLSMSELLQLTIVIAFGALCFGSGYLTAFIVTRNRWRDEMIKRGVARYNWQTGKWEWGEPPKESRY